MPDKKTEKACEQLNVEPFDTAEEAWFWFIAAYGARNDGARFAAGQGLYNRPCEPLDILKVIDGLVRNRLLKKPHLLVLRYYGRRYLAPDPRRVKEKNARKLWDEAFGHITPKLVKKGIIREQSQKSWVQEFLI
ncbi:MAG: hypothetical protein KTR28_07350 [Micavibrio sp.]|nr:hypothetical protein [Micavibrio sp.]